MRPLHLTAPLALASLLCALCLPSLASADPRIEFVSRSDGSSGSLGPITIGARTCPTGRWTFRLVLDRPATATPELWLSRDDTCTRTSGDSRCVPVEAEISPDAAPCSGAACLRFSIDSSRLVAPLTGICTPSATGYTRVFAWIGDQAVASPRVAWDTLPPAAPASVAAARVGESSVVLSWTYTIPIAIEDAAVDAGDAVVDVSDAAADVSDAAADVSDAAEDSSGHDAGEGDADLDASADAAVDAAVDAAPAADVALTRAPEFERVRRFWVLCQAFEGDSGVCGGGIGPIDLSNDEMLREYAGRCGLASDAVITGNSVSLSGLAFGRVYRFGVVAEDLAGNRSEISLAPTCDGPSASTDFWESYRASGGGAQTGCSASAGTPGRSMLLWGVIIGALARARRLHRQPRNLA